MAFPGVFMPPEKKAYPQSVLHVQNLREKEDARKNTLDKQEGLFKQGTKNTFTP
jgi:hypothetical protein